MQKVTDTSGMAWLLVIGSATVLLLIATGHFQPFIQAIRGNYASTAAPSKSKGTKSGSSKTP